MIWFIVFFSLAMISLDFIAVKRLCGVSRGKTFVWCMAFAAAADILPFISMAAAFFLSRDNTTGVMLFSSWMFFAYMVIAVCRIPFNLSVALSRSKIIRFVGAAASMAAVATIIYGMVVTRTDYEVKQVEIASPRLPKSFDGYKIVFISDLHVGTMLDPQKELKRIVEICNILQPDMVAFGGDLINIRYTELDDSESEILSSLSARDGVFSVVGNHDTGVYIRDSLSLGIEQNTKMLIEREGRLGWSVLNDKTEYIRRGCDSISVTGIAFASSLRNFRHSAEIPDVDLTPVYAAKPASVFGITIAHIPQLWDYIMPYKYSDLTLSGHVHAMQMKVPIGKRGLSLAQVMYSRWSGLYKDGDNYLYINDGVGCVLFPARIGVRPEITLLQLKTSQITAQQ